MRLPDTSLQVILMNRVCIFCVPFLSQNHRSVVAFSVRPLEDMNEITSHMLDVVQAHMVLRNSNTVRNNKGCVNLFIRVCGVHRKQMFCLFSSSSLCLERG